MIPISSDDRPITYEALVRAGIVSFPLLPLSVVDTLGAEHKVDALQDAWTSYNATIGEDKDSIISALKIQLGKYQETVDALTKNIESISVAQAESAKSMTENCMSMVANAQSSTSQPEVSPSVPPEEETEPTDASISSEQQSSDDVNIADEASFSAPSIESQTQIAAAAQAPVDRPQLMTTQTVSPVVASPMQQMPTPYMMHHPLRTLRRCLRCPRIRCNHHIQCFGHLSER